MTYKVFEVEFEDPGTLFDLNEPIGIFKAFVSAVEPTNLVGSNFNKYWDPQHDIYHPHMSIRLNLRSDEESVMHEISGVGQGLLTRSEIRHFRPIREPWSEPDFVIKAHETATACAVKFKEELDTRHELYANLTRDPLKHMGHFIRLMLQHAGFNVYIAWTFLREAPPNGINEIARSCASILSQSIGSQRPKPDFIERFLHCFFNCTIAGIENIFHDWLTKSQMWNQLVASWVLR